MKIEMGKQYRTRDGKKDVRVLCVDAGGLQPVVALLGRAIYRYTAEGMLYLDQSPDNRDLIEVKPKVQIHLVCWYDKNNPSIKGAFRVNDKEDAISHVVQYHAWYECIEKEIE